MKYLVLLIGLIGFLEQPVVAQIDKDQKAKEKSFTQSDQLSLEEALNRNSRIESFVLHLEESGLMEELKAGGPYTIFAPDGEEINELLDGIEDEDEIRKILEYHIVEGSYDVGKIVKLMNDNENRYTFQPMNQKTFELQFRAPQFFIEDRAKQKVRVIQPNMLAEGGIIHIIDQPLRKSK